MAQGFTVANHPHVYSAFFARPIVIALVYSQTLHQTSPASALVPLTLPNPAVVASASPETPIVQTRQVHLQCSGKIVCTATSRVRITSSQCARLFLEEKYAIGQMFRRLEKVLAFELLAVWSGPALLSLEFSATTLALVARLALSDLRCNCVSQR